MDERKRIDPRSGFNRASRIFHSLKPPLPLPPPNATFSATTYALSLRRNSLFPDSTTALIDATTGHRLSHYEVINRIETLANNFTSILKLSKGDTALILSPNLIQVPILCFALLSLGVVVSPANPISTRSDLTRFFHLSKPAIVFTVTSVVEKTQDFHVRTVLLDSPEFDSLTKTRIQIHPPSPLVSPVTQSDVAAILYSSGTTGMMKGVVMTHRNLTALAAGYDAVRVNRKYPAVFFFTMPFFHVYGFTLSFRAMVLSETVVIMERFSLRGMLSAVERFGVTHLAVVPPLMVALTKDSVTNGYDLKTLEGVTCGSSPLGKETAEAFKAKFPNVMILQGYGLTESTAGVARTSPEDANRAGTTGRLVSGVEAKIVNPNTGEAMFPCEQGELWIKSPSIMKGYVGDPEATSATLVDGWLRTGDLCYFDNEGFLYVVDRLKELIKYKGYQVAPAELEQYLLSHPEINDAAVIPYPDEEAGQVPMAFVVRQPQSSLSEIEIIDFVAKQCFFLGCRLHHTRK
ncbi:4-coumarate--CoA ligase-like 9 isoform X2 [Glycine max]|uniref:4-coumarate--CoA ligase-like 9 isoform X2 n=1 Tax=Glycine max TaxID=3847 RepID=UPI0007192D06|nr:4-coumarate--CoA ligase-like 9 isoform X2 [Glycine max]|eukprot:XP_014627605.1 4-coumarate--CoA ligase-like 9 isoform X2 [Glycine max]